MTDGFIADKALFESCMSGLEAEVSGVFSGGIYLAYDGGQILLHDERCGEIPFGIAVPGIKGRGHELGADIGMTAHFYNAVMTLGEMELELSYSRSEPTQTDPSVLGDFLPAAESYLSYSEKAALGIYCRAKPFDFNKDDVEDIFARAAYPGMNLLRRGMNYSDEGALEKALEGLIGLGRGLTPSCDDFVTGMLFMLTYAQEYWGIVHPMTQTVRRKIMLLSDRTNIYSAAYLKAAAEGGDFSLMRACLEKPGLESLERLCEIGSSSGTDMLAGMCFGADVILPAVR